MRRAVLLGLVCAGSLAFACGSDDDGGSSSGGSGGGGTGGGSGSGGSSTGGSSGSGGSATGGSSGSGGSATGGSGGAGGGGDASSDSSSDASTDGGGGDSSAGDGGTKLRVFVTSTQIYGDIGTTKGLAGADAFCKARATAGSLSGNWVAWLSTSSVNAISRIQGNGPWALVGSGEVAFDNKAAITAGPPKVKIDRDETGAALPTGFWGVWTATKNDGTFSGSGCTDFTVKTGQGLIGRTGTGATLAQWTEQIPFNCSFDYRLYCFEVP